MMFDNLPFIDGNRFSGGGIRSGLYPQINGEDLRYEEMTYEKDGDSVRLIFRNTPVGTFVITADETSVTFEADTDFTLKNKTKGADCEPERKVEADRLHMNYNGFDYSVRLKTGGFADEKTVLSVGRKVKIILNKEV